jgi:adsorption protein A
VVDAHVGTNNGTAAAALERALELRPDAGGYVRLAGLQTDPAQVLRSLERAEIIDEGHAAVQKALAYAYAREGRSADAVRALQRASDLDPSDVAVLMELGYSHWRAGRVAAAGEAFERAWTLDNNVATAEQLAYVHQRLHDNSRSRWYVERVIDDQYAPATTRRSVAQTERTFGLQRLHEDLGRRLTLSWDGWSGTRAGTGTSAIEVGRAGSSYTQIELDYRLGRQPIRNGTTVSAYARIIADGGDTRRTLPSRNPILGVGLRWKPLRSQVFFLAGEAQTSLDDRTQKDVLLRASASFLNEGPHGDDWHPSGTGWFAQNLYLDAAHYVDAARSGVTVDYRTGYHGKVTGNQTMEPYVHVQANGLRTVAFEHDLRAGAGVRWNLWYGAGRYDAARHKLSLGVEFQHAFDTYLDDTHGVFVTLGTRW